MKVAKTENLRIQDTKVVLPPAFLEEEIPASDRALEIVHRIRTEIKEILAGSSSRVAVVVGPCSIHDPKAAVEYAGRLREASEEFARDLRIVMRVYFEKPRTTVGWRASSTTRTWMARAESMRAYASGAGCSSIWPKWGFPRVRNSST